MRNGNAMAFVDQLLGESAGEDHDVRGGDGWDAAEAVAAGVALMQKAQFALGGRKQMQPYGPLMGSVQTFEEADLARIVSELLDIISSITADGTLTPADKADAIRRVALELPGRLAELGIDVEQSGAKAVSGGNPALAYVDDLLGTLATGSKDWTTQYINDLPDSSFASIEPGGKKDAGGKTVPRSLRHFPHHDSAGKLDLPHFRSALGRAGQSPHGPKAMAHLKGHQAELAKAGATRVVARDGQHTRGMAPGTPKRIAHDGEQQKERHATGPAGAFVDQLAELAVS